MSLPAMMEAERQLSEALLQRDLEEVRQNADLIRLKCKSFSTFVKEAWHVIEPSTPLIWNWHLQAMCDCLEAITFGRLHPRLIINIPPGCSKSTIVSVMWQAWEWGPCGLRGNRFLSTSYEEGNVTRDTRKTRNLILSEWFHELWPIEFTRRGENSFENVETGTREGVSFAALTAKRGDRLTIDDPHSLLGAESDTQRDKAVLNFIEGGQNRLNDPTRSAIVIVMQRLHEADLTGAILAREVGYLHLMLPMEFEEERKCVVRDKKGAVFFEDPRAIDGELLDPARFTREVVDRDYKSANDYAWAGQYQQRPAPREGGMFKVDTIQKVDGSEIGEGARHVRGWDIAGSVKKRSAFTAGAHLALYEGIVYIVHVQRAKKEIDQAERMIVETAQDDHDRYGSKMVQSLPQDPGQAGKSQKFHLANALAGTNFKFSPESGEKQNRAIPFASMVNSGKVRMVRGTWNSALENEMRNFPGSLYKDQVDALSRAFMELIPYMNQKRKRLAAPIYVQSAEN